MQVAKGYRVRALRQARGRCAQALRELRGVSQGDLTTHTMHRRDRGLQGGLRGLGRRIVLHAGGHDDAKEN